VGDNFTPLFMKNWSKSVLKTLLLPIISEKSFGQKNTAFSQEEKAVLKIYKF
jgi:hypothetical protein